ncbi:MAG: Neelaredoxin [Anaerolineales bacterium]|nr:MAG: Neelaredoxin [Anaerolineales bacterium]
MKLGDGIQSADWKMEKHVPTIDAPDVVKADEVFTVTVSVGKEIAHPNTTAHHIAWIELYFKPEGDKFLYEVGRFDFTGHGASAKGADTGPVYTQPSAVIPVKVSGSGTLVAVGSCNIHGLWEGSKEVKVA